MLFGRGVVFILFACVTVTRARSKDQLDVVFRWQQIDFEYPNEAARQSHILSGDYVPGTNSLPLDVDVWYKGKDRTVFVTFPKFRKGVPVTLGVVSPRTRGNSHLVLPYPDWSWQSQTNCEGLISVFRTQVDKCDRLWVIDSGVVDLSLATRRRQCRPKLLAFNLNSGQLAGKHLFPDHLLKQDNSLLTNVVVDVRNSHNSECRDTFAYVSDTVGYSLLVLDIRRNRSWNVQSNSMYPYPSKGFFQTNNVEFNLMDGILGMALGPTDKGDRTLYYHSLASVRESWVPTSVLKNEDYFTEGQNLAFKQFKTSEEARRFQSAAEAFDKNGNLYFGMVDNTLSCWHHGKPFTRENIHEIARDNVNLQFASGLKVVENGDGDEEVWLVTNRFQRTMVGDLDPSEVNFRILRGNLTELTRNSQCQQSNFITFPNRTTGYGSRPFEKPLNSGYGRS